MWLATDRVGRRSKSGGDRWERDEAELQGSVEFEHVPRHRRGPGEQRRVAAGTCGPGLRESRSRREMREADVGGPGKSGRKFRLHDVANGRGSLDALVRPYRGRPGTSRLRGAPAKQAVLLPRISVGSSMPSKVSMAVNQARSRSAGESSGFGLGEFEMPV